MDRQGFKCRYTGLTWWGGKFNSLPLILSYFPEPTQKIVFVDVFAGGGSVSLNYGAKNVVMNDKFDLLYNFYYVLSGVSFKKLLERYPTSKKSEFWKQRIELYDHFSSEIEFTQRGPAWFEEYANREDKVGKAIFFCLLNKNNFSGIVEPTRPQPWDFRCPRGIPYNRFEELKKFFQRSDVRIWDLDFRIVLKKVEKWSDTDLQQIFLYLDPPYPSEQRYECGFKERDTLDLAELLLESSHHWIMSNEDSKFIRETFEKCHIKEVQWQYTGAVKHATQGRSELLISNRPFVKRNLIRNKTLDIWVRK